MTALNSHEIVIFGAILDKALIFDSKTDWIDVVEDKDENIFCFPSQSTMVRKDTVVTLCYDANK